MQKQKTAGARAVVLALTTLTAATMVSGCVYRRETVPAAAPATVIVAPTAADRVVTYPEGRYELRGDGSTQSPYVWVWIPTGATAPANLPPLPRR